MKTLASKMDAGLGIGKAIAELFAAEGASVLLADIHQQNIQAYRCWLFIGRIISFKQCR